MRLCWQNVQGEGKTHGRYTEGDSAARYNKNVLYARGPSEGWLPDYNLLMLTENAVNVRCTSEQ